MYPVCQSKEGHDGDVFKELCERVGLLEINELKHI